MKIGSVTLAMMEEIFRATSCFNILPGRYIEIF